jgi:hypothetical protein
LESETRLKIEVCCKNVYIHLCSQTRAPQNGKSEIKTVLVFYIFRNDWDDVWNTKIVLHPREVINSYVKRHLKTKGRHDTVVRVVVAPITRQAKFIETIIAAKTGD